MVGSPVVGSPVAGSLVAGSLVADHLRVHSPAGSDNLVGSERQPSL